ncbi:DUF1080 domain-containing protein [Lentisphaera profundi]|uniref:DUF1080 domain-containing protein n=1 Tax=Lentisphaera profundi TaxID=1658616 RepID=A0ABY7W0Q0_9BACT|nr:DUF1080 domain-containing protein [Lentisphaera profundi]WDE98606.1 DUF1080 domain-containing protein [Lentisphaera profundi]
MKLINCLTLTFLTVLFTCSSSASTTDDGFTKIFNGENFDGWTILKHPHKRYQKIVQDENFGHLIKNGAIVTQAAPGNLYTTKQYSDYILRFEFKLEAAANNGLALRAPLKGIPAYANFELQILDNSSKKYAKLKPYQYHGSLYGQKAAKRGFLKPLGEWNSQEVSIIGTEVKVILNGTVILEANLKDYKKATFQRPKGHLCFAGHGAGVSLREIYIKDLTQ